jgi:hypothetical protein
MSVYNFFPSTAATRANRLFSFSSSAAMRANLSCSCWASHGRATPHRNVDVVFRFARDSPLEGDGFELPVPQQIHSRFRVRARSIGMHPKIRFRSRLRAGGRWIRTPGPQMDRVSRKWRCRAVCSAAVATPAATQSANPAEKRPVNADWSVQLIRRFAAATPGLPSDGRARP